LGAPATTTGNDYISSGAALISKALCMYSEF